MGARFCWIPDAVFIWTFSLLLWLVPSQTGFRLIRAAKKVIKTEKAGQSESNFRASKKREKRGNTKNFVYALSFFCK